MFNTRLSYPVGLLLGLLLGAALFLLLAAEDPGTPLRFLYEAF